MKEKEQQINNMECVFVEKKNAKQFYAMRE